jgi:hypothetical protein
MISKCGTGAVAQGCDVKYISGSTVNKAVYATMPVSYLHSSQIASCSEMILTYPLYKHT